MRFPDDAKDDDAVMEDDPLPVTTIHVSCTASLLYGFMLGCVLGLMVGVVLLVAGAVYVALVGC
jgi:uncharacterized membrane protein